MTMKWYSYNLVNQEGTILTASSENAQFPVNNLKHDFSSKVYRSTTPSANVVIDILNPQPVDSVIVKANFELGRGFNGDLTIEANATDEWSSPAFTTTLSLNDEFNFGKVEFNTEEYRFWRVSGTGSEYLELANLFIGQKIELTSNNIDYGWTLSSNDNTKSKSNDFGQEFFDIYNIQRMITCSYKLVNKTEFDQLYAMFDYNKTYIPVWCIVDDNGIIINDKERFAGCFYFESIPSHKNSSFSLYDFSIKIKEVI